MERLLTAGEALEHVVGNTDDPYSSADESEIDEDPQFPLPEAYSDDESQGPGSPAQVGVVNTHAPTLQTASMCTAAACATTSSTSMAALAAAPSTPSAGTGSTQRGTGVESFIIIKKYIIEYINSLHVACIVASLLARMTALHTRTCVRGMQM